MGISRVQNAISGVFMVCEINSNRIKTDDHKFVRKRKLNEGEDRKKELTWADHGGREKLEIILN